MKQHKYYKILEEKRCVGKPYKEYLAQYGLHVAKEWGGCIRGLKKKDSPKRV